MGFQLKVGGKFHLRLNTGSRPIANKYCEGKMKRTLKRELKGLEIAKREPFGISVAFVLFTAGMTPAASGAFAGQHRLGARESALREGGLALICLGCLVVIARWECVVRPTEGIRSCAGNQPGGVPGERRGGLSMLIRHALPCQFPSTGAR